MTWQQCSHHYLFAFISVPAIGASEILRNMGKDDGQQKMRRGEQP
jgi:hypothetical protein